MNEYEYAVAREVSRKLTTVIMLSLSAVIVAVVFFLGRISTKSDPDLPEPPVSLVLEAKGVQKLLSERWDADKCFFNNRTIKEAKETLVSFQEYKKGSEYKELELSYKTVTSACMRVSKRDLRAVFRHRVKEIMGKSLENAKVGISFVYHEEENNWVVEVIYDQYGHPSTDKVFMKLVNDQKNVFISSGLSGVRFKDKGSYRDYEPEWSKSDIADYFERLYEEYIKSLM